MKEHVELNSTNILVTGAAGFIGSNLVKRLLKETTNSLIIGIDSLTNYNPLEIKEWRLHELECAAKKSNSKFMFIQGNISNSIIIKKIFKKYNFSVVVNMAVQAGVRYSITNPDSYIDSNVIGFYNVLEACRHSYDNGSHGVSHFIYASSSSVYGGNKKIPFSTEDMVDHPVSLYAATKKSNELMAYAYSKLYNIPSTGLRFFTVYGPAGRTDMFYFLATNKLCTGQKIQIFNFGNCKRDFTYIDDVVEGLVRVMKGAPQKAIGEDGLPLPPYSIYNVGGGKPENLLHFIDVLQQELIRAEVLPSDFDFNAYKELVPMQSGDVPITYADCEALKRDFGFTPKVGISEGLRNFAEWYKKFYI